MDCCVTLNQYLDRRKQMFLQNCRICGECLKSCDLLNYWGADFNPQEIQRERLDFLKTGQFSQTVADFNWRCRQCAGCNDNCPEDLHPSWMVEIIARDLVNSGHPAPDSLEIAMSTKPLSLVDIMTSIQMSPSDARWLTEVPENPEPVDIVLFTGCFSLSLPDSIFATIDVFEKMGLKFATLGGGSNFCCGGVYAICGYTEESEKQTKKLLAAVDALKAKTLVFFCPQCKLRVAGILSSIVQPPFELKFLSEFLADNIDKLKFTTPLPKKVTIHDPCGHNFGRKENESYRRVLAAIPGVEIVEMDHNRENALCCGGATQLVDPVATKKATKVRLEEACRTGADILVSLCSGCHMTFAPEQNNYPFEILHFGTLLGRAMGIDYEDKYKKYMLYGSAEKVLQDADKYIEQSPCDHEAVRQAVKMMFGS